MNILLKHCALAACLACVPPGAASATTLPFVITTTGEFTGTIDLDPNTPTSPSPSMTFEWGQSGDDATVQSKMEIVATTSDLVVRPGLHDYEVGRIEWTNREWTNWDSFFDLLGVMSFSVGEMTTTDMFTLAIGTTDNAALEQSGDVATLWWFNDFCLSKSCDEDERVALSEAPYELASGVSLVDIVLTVSGEGILRTDSAGRPQWTTFEKGTSSLHFNARIQNEHLPPVPLPAAAWMLIAGIGGLVAMKRRQKARV